MNTEHSMALSCYATLVLQSGSVESGIVRAVRSEQQQTPVGEWVSDATIAQREAVDAAAKSAQNWRNFPGDIAAWSGIPPLPRTASRYQTEKASTHCTITDTADHVATVWASSGDCRRWIEDAQKFATAGPTRAQIEGYRRDQCINSLSRTASQSYSGESYGICSGVAPRPMHPTR
ncbi:hypothetical protein [Cupriavidus sp. D39]|uniref:hypothetical protein n=1 Tax=Cupriavidus sp. D39 TaxID=2997877 RepID=UPI00226FE955|nr:hypothetical protein [Cupriavidus sp. D39]MCY0852542.1 hypothetical protein [Cupriavidus sp. D39]